MIVCQVRILLSGLLASMPQQSSYHGKRFRVFGTNTSKGVSKIVDSKLGFIHRSTHLGPYLRSSAKIGVGLSF